MLCFHCPIPIPRPIPIPIPIVCRSAPLGPILIVIPMVIPMDSSYENYLNPTLSVPISVPSGGKIANTSRGHGVLPFPIGRTWFKLAVTSSKRFLPVVVHDK